MFEGNCTRDECAALRGGWRPLLGILKTVNGGASSWNSTLRALASWIYGAMRSDRRA